MEQVWLAFNDILLQKDPKVRRATFEGKRDDVETVLEWPQNITGQYTIYSYGKLLEIETDRRAAVETAFDTYGGVLDDAQRYVFQRGSWPTSYIIDRASISDQLMAAGCSGSVEAFANAIGSDKELLNFSGTMTTGMFYPISRGHAVYAAVPGGSWLLAGYTEEVIMYYDGTGELKEIEREKADARFLQAGYVFYTYQNKPASVQIAEAAAETAAVEAAAEAIPES